MLNQDCNKKRDSNKKVNKIYRFKLEKQKNKFKLYKKELISLKLKLKILNCIE